MQRDAYGQETETERGMLCARTRLARVGAPSRRFARFNKRLSLMYMCKTMYESPGINRMYSCSAYVYAGAYIHTYTHTYIHICHHTCVFMDILLYTGYVPDQSRLLLTMQVGKNKCV